MTSEAPKPPFWDNTTICFGEDCPNCERERAKPAEPKASEPGRHRQGTECPQAKAEDRMSKREVWVIEYNCDGKRGLTGAFISQAGAWAEKAELDISHPDRERRIVRYVPAKPKAKKVKK